MQVDGVWAERLHHHLGPFQRAKGIDRIEADPGVGRELGDDAGERDGFQPVMVLNGDDDAGRPAILADCGQPLDDLGL